MSSRQEDTFSLEEDEILIEYVRENEALYDFSNKRYADSMYKNTLWNTIGTKLQKDGQQCKHRWESIRGQYRKVIKSKKTTTGQSADIRSTWKYEDQLKFLRPHMKDKQRLTSIINETSSVSTDTEDEYLSQNQDMSNTENLNVPEVTTVDIPQLPSKKRKPVQKIANNSNATNQTANGTLMKYLLENEKKTSAERDELDHFFDRIKATVNKFSTADKHLAKKEIFKIASDIEGRYIGQQISSHIPTHSTYFHRNVQPNIQPQINSQFQQFQYQPLLSSTQSPSSLIPIASRPPSSVSVPESSSTSSYYENFSPSDNNYE